MHAQKVCTGNHVSLNSILYLYFIDCELVALLEDDTGMEVRTFDNWLYLGNFIFHLKGFKDAMKCIVMQSTGMYFQLQLLVNKKIISLDLPVSEVYKKIWAPEHGEGEPMPIIYRMRGLLGDATEDMVNSLDSNTGSGLVGKLVNNFLLLYNVHVVKLLSFWHILNLVSTEEDVDKEEVYKMAAVLAEGDGLKVMLSRYVWYMYFSMPFEDLLKSC